MFVLDTYNGIKDADIIYYSTENCHLQAQCFQSKIIVLAMAAFNVKM
jgi:hypothetical protein